MCPPPGVLPHCSCPPPPPPKKTTTWCFLPNSLCLPPGVLPLVPPTWCLTKLLMPPPKLGVLPYCSCPHQVPYHIACTPYCVSYLATCGYHGVSYLTALAGQYCHGYPWMSSVVAHLIFTLLPSWGHLDSSSSPTTTATVNAIGTTTLALSVYSSPLQPQPL